jgi:hypothetical protein
MLESLLTEDMGGQNVRRPLSQLGNLSGQVSLLYGRAVGLEVRM